MPTIPDGMPLAPDQQTQPAYPQLDTAEAAVSQRQPQRAVVSLPGEIDITNDGRVQDTLTRALDDRTAVLIADASRTTFCGCAGVYALLLTHHRAAAAGVQLRVAAGPAMRRILELMGADHVLDTYPTLAAALAGRSRSQPLRADFALTASASTRDRITAARPLRARCAPHRTANRGEIDRSAG